MQPTVSWESSEPRLPSILRRCDNGRPKRGTEDGAFNVGNVVAPISPGPPDGSTMSELVVGIIGDVLGAAAAKAAGVG